MTNHHNTFMTNQICRIILVQSESETFDVISCKCNYGSHPSMFARKNNKVEKRLGAMTTTQSLQPLEAIPLHGNSGPFNYSGYKITPSELRSFLLKRVQCQYCTGLATLLQNSTSFIVTHWRISCRGHRRFFSARKNGNCVDLNNWSNA